MSDRTRLEHADSMEYGKLWPIEAYIDALVIICAGHMTINLLDLNQIVNIIVSISFYLLGIQSVITFAVQIRTPSSETNSPQNSSILGTTLVLPFVQYVLGHLPCNLSIA